MLSISRNAAEWLADLNDSVTLLLSPMANVFNGDTECYSKQTDAIFCPMTTPLEYFDSFNVALYALASTETSESSPAIVFEESRLT